MAGRPRAPTNIVPPANLRPSADLCDLDITHRDLVLLTVDAESTMRWLATYHLLGNSRNHHHLHFVHPNNPSVHTNTIKGTWVHVKAKLCSQHGTSDGLFDSHLSEFLWRRLYPEKCFGNFFYWVTHYYAV